MIDLASIRNASFTLTPTGYNPEEVDQFLADLADQLAAAPAASVPAAPVQVEVPTFAVEAPVPVAEPLTMELPDPPHLPQPYVTERPTDQIDRLQRAVESTIGAMEAFVAGELASVREASNLDVEEIHRERQRLLEEAGEAARAHLDETRSRADRMLEEAREQAEAMRRRSDAELQAERERFEQALADRDAQAQARVAEVLAEAQARRDEAEQQVANADRVQAQVLASLEQARASLAEAEPGPARESQAAPFSPADDPFEPPVRSSSLQAALAERAGDPDGDEGAFDGADASDAAA
jgi:DivIVA domain-containing protein